jgi:hypothetical protein
MNTTEREYPRRVSHYETDEGLELLKKLAKKRGVTATALLRILIREEAARVGVTVGGPKRKARPAAVTGEER